MKNVAVPGAKYVEQLLILGTGSSSCIAVAFWTLEFLYYQSCRSVVQDESQQKSMNHHPLAGM